MSPFLKGFAISLASILGGSIAVGLFSIGIEARLELSDDALPVVAQVGATLLVAYAVETSWFVKTSRVRGREREVWVGFVAGIGLSSALGVGLAIAFIGQQSTRFAEASAAAWVIFSLGLLGLLVALLPYLLYEWAHAVRTEHPDE